MVFRASNTNKYWAMLVAYRTINMYKMSTREILLNKYCLKEYKKSLKQICRTLVMNAKFNTLDKDLIITFKTKKEDNLATLITYGNGELYGSNILKAAFGRK